MRRIRASLPFFVLTTVILFVSAAPSFAAMPPSAPREAPPQLNVPGFASCLAQQAPHPDLERERADNRLNPQDLLLLYLSVYPGKRLPRPASFLQDKAHRRWARAYESREKRLAERFVARQEGSSSVSPARFFADALEACKGGVFCGSLISHNVLRTLGRHERAIYRDRWTGELRDLNPRWFTGEASAWLLRIPALQNLMLNLRPDQGGDRWGEWYHFFGILAYSLHELALNQEIQNVELVVRLGELLNPWLAGGPEGAEKARLDRDSVQVAWRFLRGNPGPAPISCDERESYVAPSECVNCVFGTGMATFPE